ncbi:vacuolar protein sorting/targeting protein PEP1 [Savitreella phatthalungensis]
MSARAGMLLRWILLVGLALAAEPIVTINTLPHLPRRLRYFANSSSILYLDERQGRVYQSDDDGVTWNDVAAKDDQVIDFYLHPYEDYRGYVLTASQSHYATEDRGRTWRKFETPGPPSQVQDALVFSAANRDDVIFMSEKCTESKSSFLGSKCRDHAYLSRKNFGESAQSLRLLVANAASCVFAAGTPALAKTADPELIICSREDPDSSLRWPLNLQLVGSRDGFKSLAKIEVDSRGITGVVGLGAVQSFIVVASHSAGSDELSLFVSDDGESWDRAEFPKLSNGRLEEDAYTVLESRPYSIQVDVLSSSDTSNTFGSLYTSNSNGTYFSCKLEHTNRNELGIVDFENIELLDGIAVANVVANHEDVSREKSTVKRLRTLLTFDDGRNWHNLTADAESLHLHSAGEPHNTGRIFSSHVPGILMGIGNTGEHLESYAKGDLYISVDAGLNWSKALNGPQKYEWGNGGGVLVSVRDDRKPVDELCYSMDRGESWATVSLGRKLLPRILTTVPDASLAKFILVGSDPGGAPPLVVAIDFTTALGRRCGEDDFEKWSVRTHETGEPACHMGHKQFYMRKKTEARCFVADWSASDEQEPCECSKDDYECDYNFVEDKGSCVPVSIRAIMPAGACKPGDKTFRASSGYRKIPGNTCKGEALELTEERDCPKQDDAAKDLPTVVSHDLPDSIKQYFFLERTENASGDDETIVAHLENGEVWITHDFGLQWARVLEAEEIVAVIPHRYFKDWLYCLTEGKIAFVSKDRGQTFRKLSLPAPPNAMGRPIFEFHSTRSGKLIFMGQQGCERASAHNCRITAFRTENGGGDWEKLYDHVEGCAYIGMTAVDARADLVYCTTRLDDSGDLTGRLQLASSVDFFETRKTHFEEVLGFAVFDEFVVVAEVHDGSTLLMQTSVNGEVFAEARFPPRFRVEERQAYTVLDSVTRSIFMHVTINDDADKEYGSVLKSNSNGTYFVTSLDAVNRNRQGYVDFEKLKGLEGVAVVNIVKNQADVDAGLSHKQLQTMMTHNDGGAWSLLKAPERDSRGEVIACTDGCSLNLHGYTERADIRDTYSSGSAIGILIAVGNAGSSLTPYNESNTFMSTDGGIEWREIAKGPHQWEYGDSGSIIVLALDDAETQHVLFTLDEGRTWNNMTFVDEPVRIKDIATLPSDTSQRFVIFAHKAFHRRASSYLLDFGVMRSRQCKLSDDELRDFYLWTPSHPSNEASCLFGHVSQYHRKRPDADCFVGQQRPHSHEILRNCTCTIQDFECDYNYQRANDGTCQLIPGLDPPDHSALCAKDPSLVSWSEPTGYRRIPLTTCAGGPHFDRAEEHPCPGKEAEFGRTRESAIGGFGVFTIIVLCFGSAGAIGYSVYRKGLHRVGQIRLGDEPRRDADNFAVEAAINVVSAAVAIAFAIPVVVRSLYGIVRRRLASRRGYDPLDAEVLVDDFDDF